jgi:hypothetical protein
LLAKANAKGWPMPPAAPVNKIRFSLRFMLQPAANSLE